MTASAHQVHLVPLDDIKPYPGNPRDNEPAIDAVMASILQFGFRIPVVLDKDGVLIAGHTRVDALKKIRALDPATFEARFAEGIPAFYAVDLSEDQVRAFRVVDNKTSELAKWNFDLLAAEVAGLAEAGIQLQDFGWTEEEVDCLRGVVADDCLNPENWKGDSGAPEASPDGVDTAFLKPKRLGEGADGLSVRVVIGTFGFLVSREDYDAWFNQVMKDQDFDFDKATDDVADRLGLLDAKRARDSAAARQRDALASAGQRHTSSEDATTSASEDAVHSVLEDTNA